MIFSVALPDDVTQDHLLAHSLIKLMAASRKNVLSCVKINDYFAALISYRMIESEKITRKKQIDKNLTRNGWKILPYQLGLNTSVLSKHAVEEYPTTNGRRADYALFVNGKLLGIIEAKKYGIAAQNVLEQAKRYAKGVVHNIGRWGEYMVPFLKPMNRPVCCWKE